MSVGIKETREAFVGGLEVGLFSVKRFKDGVQGEDFLAFYNAFVNDPAFKAIVQSAYENYQAIPEEVSDLDLGEGLELGTVALSYVPKFVGALVA